MPNADCAAQASWPLPSGFVEDPVGKEHVSSQELFDWVTNDQ